MSFPWKTLERRLARRERRSIERFLLGLFQWEDDLRSFPRVPGELTRATPFVSVYARGTLRGCYGSTEGLARAALGALCDVRFGGIRPGERKVLAAEVAFLRAPREIEVADLQSEIALGSEGVAYVRPEGLTLLMPSVARDEGLDASRLLAVLAEKARVPIDGRGGRLYLFSCQSIVVRRGRSKTARDESPTDAAARWLSERVAKDGSVEFGCDPRWGTRHAEGPFVHARSAIAIAALAAHGGHRGATERARRWLARELRRARSGKRVAMFPEHPAEVAGTLALAKIAGVDTHSELVALAAQPAILENTWHAAQVVLALGAAAPKSLWHACVRDLTARPWAPWTVMAARALGDRETLARAERVLSDSILTSAPFRGAANVRPIPELALTAAVVEALAPSRDRRARAAVERGRSFLLEHQFRGDSIPAALDPELADGGFPLSVVVPALRSDVTAHALLALL